MIRRNRRQGMIKQKQKARLGWAGHGRSWTKWERENDHLGKETWCLAATCIAMEFMRFVIILDVEYYNHVKRVYSKSGQNWNGNRTHGFW